VLVTTANLAQLYLKYRNGHHALHDGFVFSVTSSVTLKQTVFWLNLIKVAFEMEASMHMYSHVIRS